MTSKPQCHFCAHDNPAGSKYCNDCGSPLDLKPCPGCEAMNHVSAERCYQCGASFPADYALEAAEVGAAANGVSASVAPPSRAEPGTRSTIPMAFAGRPKTMQAPAAATQRRGVRAAEPQQRDPACIELPEPVGASGPWAAAGESATDPRRGHAVPSHRRNGAAYGMLAGVLLCAIAGAAYYAHESGLSLRIVSATEPSGDPPAAAAKVAAPVAQPSTETAATAATPQGVAPDVSAPTLRQPAPSTGTSASPTTSTASAPTVAPPPSRVRAASAPVQASGAAEVDESNAQASPESPNTAARHGSTRQRVDRDALATQRLIERDLAGFLPPGNTPQSAPRQP